MIKPKIGAHISMGGGLSKGIKRAKEMEVECMQIFAGSPRRYEVSLPTSIEIEKYKEDLEKEEIKPVYIHASYLVNLASEESNILQKSIKNISQTIDFANLINAEGVIYHPGSPKGSVKKKAIEREIKSILKILEKDSDGKSFLVIENTAGKKKIGTDPTEIGYIFKKINSSRLKVCVDTAHSLEAGNIKDFSEKKIREWILWWDREVGLKNIAAFHINDSLTSFGSQNDRHANIGEGYIGKKGFENLINIRETQHIPWILEVPGFDNKGPDKQNVDIIKRIRKKVIG